MKNLYVIIPEKIGRIAPEIYGHFAEHIGGVMYDGMWVGKDSPVPNINGLRKELVEKFRKINPPMLRWPGGCFAETYDWRDGIGPQTDRPVRVNWWHGHDGRYEPNSVGTHEFVEFCRLTGAEPYFAANITSTTPLEIRNWIDYCNSPRGTTTLAKLREENGSPEPFNIRYWGVGNETWGGGGNMTAEVYAHEYRKYAVLMRNMSRDLELIGSGANSIDYSWTKKFMEVFDTSERHMDGFSLHYYCGSCGNPTDFSKDDWYQLLAQAGGIEEALVRHWRIIEGFGFEKWGGLVIDEWGAWHPDGSGPSKGYNLFEQQNTIRDALVAAVTLNIFNNHCDKIKMAAIAQLVNNLHSLFLAEGENFITTPTYHIFDMLQGHMGGEAVRTIAENEEISFTNPHDGMKNRVKKLSASASVRDGVLTVTAVNLSADEDETVKLDLTAGILGNKAKISTLTHDELTAHNTFDKPDEVTVKTEEITGFDGCVRIPRGSVVNITVQVK